MGNRDGQPPALPFLTLPTLQSACHRVCQQLTDPATTEQGASVEGQQRRTAPGLPLGEAHALLQSARHKTCTD